MRLKNRTLKSIQQTTENSFNLFHPDILDTALKQLDAKLALVNVLSVDQKTCEYLLRKAKIYILKQDFLQSIQILQKISSHPINKSNQVYHFESKYYLGCLHHRLTEYDKAIDYFTEAISLFPKEVKKDLPWHRKIQKTFLEMQHKKHKVVKSISDKSPHILDPYSLNEKRLLRDAMEKQLFEFLHESATHLSCTLDELFTARGLSHLIHYNFSSAKEDFSTALALYATQKEGQEEVLPSDFKLQALYLNYGLAYYYNRQFEESELWFSKSITIAQTLLTDQTKEEEVFFEKVKHGLIQSYLYRFAVRERTKQIDLALEDEQKLKELKHTDKVEYFHFRLVSLEMLWEILSFLNTKELLCTVSVVNRFFNKQCNYVHTHATLFQ